MAVLSMGSAAVEVVDLVKVYGTRRALDHLSLRVERGQIHALLGPNGAGKTTAIEICEGFRRADSGQVRVLGLDPQHQHAQLAPRVGVMLQEGVGAYTGARTLELLELFASYASNPYPPAELLERLGISDAAAVPVKRLSGGQRQRLSLAMALVGRPELVFLDEPTAGMDPQARRGAWELVEQLRSDGVCVVLTTHFLDEAERLADVVTMIAAGRVAAEGTPAELTRTGATGQIRFTARPGLALGTLATVLPNQMEVREESRGRYLLTGSVDPQVLASLTAWCASEGILAEDLTVARRTLEDVFLELTEERAAR